MRSKVSFVPLLIAYSYLLLELPSALSRRLIVSSRADILRRKCKFSAFWVRNEGEDGRLEEELRVPGTIDDAPFCMLDDRLEDDKEWGP
jgi:hypothetical protein